MTSDLIEVLITKELLNITSKEISEKFDPESSDLLINKVSLFMKEAIEQTNSFEIIIDHFNKEKKLSKLKKTLSLFSFLNDNIEDVQLINKRRLENTDNKLYVFIWLYHKIEIFSDDEYFEYELIDFLTEVFTKYDWLFYIDDFFDEVHILNIIDDVWLTDKVVSLFEKASERNPEILRLNIVLAMAYNERNEFAKAFDMVDLLLNSLKKTDAENKDAKLFYIRLRSEIYFKSGDLDKSLIDINYIIEQEGNNDPFSYFKTFLLRITINLKKNNIEQLGSDSLILINSIGISEIFLYLSDYYPDANNYIEQYIKKMAKEHTIKYNEKTNDKIFKINSEIGKIEVSGNDNWKWQDKIIPYFDIKLKNKKTISIKLINASSIQDIEVLYDKKLTKEEKIIIVNWLNSPSTLSKKNIGIETTNIRYMVIVWEFLNAENSVRDIE